MLQTLKNWTLPIAMLLGLLLYPWLVEAAFLMPWLLFGMLLFSFCNVSPRSVKFSSLHVWLLLIQLVGCIVVYSLLALFNPVVAQGTFICVLAPTAAAAAVITGMLGGSVPFLTSYVIFCNIGVSVAAPILFSFIGTNRELPFWESVWNICQEVFPLLILPLLCAWGLQYFVPRVHAWMVRRSKIAFYLWAVSLTIVTGVTVSFLVEQGGSAYREEWIIAGITLAVCVGQFLLGRRLGRHYGDPVSAGQGLGQKNTVLAIWMSHIYLDPIASVGPAAYILWQNIINSWQLWRKRKNEIKQ